MRVIAATNRNLREEVSEGRFREDLYYRLNVIGVEVPSLRERREDIPVLATAFLERFALANRKEIKGFTPQAMDALLKYSWPGNVRELENAVERAAILCLGEYISERELPMAVSSAPKNNDAPTLAELQGAAGEEPISMTLDEMERAAILRTLQDTGDNKSEAARRLGITRATLHNKLRRYDME
ncbi:MAG: helix-turn-helix domain-containing protein [Bilophila wadsworthia]